MGTKNKKANLDIFKSYLKDGMSIMFGGFMGVGTPELLVDGILQSGVKELTIIGNDTAFPTTGVGRLVSAGVVKHVIASHIGTNPETGKKMIAGELQVTLVPQGTLAEQIRAAGAGLGGILTPTGLGTVVADGKQIIQANGQDYILELPIKADLAILHATQADMYANLFFAKASKNFNTLIATAADVVFAQVDEITTKPLNPETVSTPGVFVDYIIF